MNRQILYVCVVSALVFQCASRKEGQSESKTIGGVQAAAGQFPATVLLPDQLCTGTIIGKNAILTAAHCVLDEKLSIRTTLAPGVKVSVGASETITNKSLTPYTVSAVELHPSAAEVRAEMLKLGPTDDKSLIKLVYNSRVSDLAVIIVHEDFAKPYAAISPVPQVKSQDLILQGYGKPYFNSSGPGNTLNYYKRRYAKLLSTRMWFNAADEAQRDDILRRKSLTAGDSGGATYVEAALNKAVVVGVNSGGELTDIADPIAEIKAQGLDPFANDLEAIHKIMLGDYFVARTDWLAGSPSAGLWLTRFAEATRGNPLLCFTRDRVDPGYRLVLVEPEGRVLGYTVVLETVGRESTIESVSASGPLDNLTASFGTIKITSSTNKIIGQLTMLGQGARNLLCERSR